MSKWYDIKAVGKSAGEVSIFGDIGSYGVTAKDFARDLKALGAIGEMDVFLNTRGGSLMEGIAIYNIINRHPAHVNVNILGIALSMGSVIAAAGDKVSMPENAIMMVHSAQTDVEGNATELRKRADIVDKFNEGIVSAYVKKTGKTAEEIKEIMEEETWFTAADAVEAGFADEVTDAVEATAHFDLSAFGNIPADIKAKFEQKQVSVKAESKPTVVGKPKERGDNMSDTKDKATDNPVDVTAIAATAKVEALATEKTRQTDIRAVFAKHESHSNVMDTCLEDQNVTVEAARTSLLDAIGKDSKPVTVTGVVGGDVADKFREGATQALLIRSGLAKNDGTNEFRGLSLSDLARHSLEIHNVGIKGMRKMDIVGAAFTHSTSDFPYLLENTIGKRLQASYDTASETWRQWCTVGEVSDFKANSRIRMGSFNSLDTIAEGGEYTHGTLGEEKETIQAATKGKMISLSRQMIINDDLAGFMRIASLMGRAAARTVGNDAYSILINNAVLNDGAALFHADHSNLAGAGGAPTVVTVGAGRKSMRMQQDMNSNDYLDIRPKYILGPVALEDTLAVLMASETDPSQGNSKKPNAVRNAATVITDPRLDADSATAWYMIADQNEAPTVEVAFLDGVDTPYLESQNGFKIDGVEWKVRLDYGTAATDFRGAYKNAGA